MNAADVIWGPVQSPNEFAEDVQVVANGYILDAAARRRLDHARRCRAPRSSTAHRSPRARPRPTSASTPTPCSRELGWDADRIAAAKASGFAG